MLSGGEKNRMLYGKLMLTRPNVLLMDEPTNHMDVETIELRPGWRIADFSGTYDEYLKSQGIAG